MHHRYITAPKQAQNICPQLANQKSGLSYETSTNKEVIIWPQLISDRKLKKEITGVFDWPWVKWRAG